MRYILVSFTALTNALKNKFGTALRDKAGRFHNDSLETLRHVTITGDSTDYVILKWRGTAPNIIPARYTEVAADYKNKIFTRAEILTFLKNNAVEIATV